MDSNFEVLKNMFSLEISNEIEIYASEIIIFLTIGKYKIKRSNIKLLLQKNRIVQSRIFNHDCGYNNIKNSNINKLYLKSKDDVIDYIFSIYFKFIY